jgi:very-short-patch-repair endonuclease
MGERYSKIQKEYLFSVENLNNLKKMNEKVSLTPVWNKGLTSANNEKVRKIGQNIRKNALNNPNFGNRGKKFTEEHKRKIAIANIGLKRSEETKKLISIRKIGTKRTEEERRKISIKTTGKGNPFYGKKHSEETKQKLRNKHKKWWLIPENRIKILNEVMLQKRLDGLMKRPTSLEKQMIDIIEKHNLPYRYTGDGAVLIGYKNPDFVNVNGEKICIEVANTIHHAIDYETKRKEHFKKWGWDCIVFRTNKLIEEEVLQKINSFNEMKEMNRLGV